MPIFNGEAAKAPQRQRRKTQPLVKQGDIAPDISPTALSQFYVSEATEGAQEAKLAALKVIMDGPPSLDFSSEPVQAILAGGAPDDAARLLTRSAARIQERVAANERRLADDWRTGHYPYKYKMLRKDYEGQKFQLQAELLKLQAWVKGCGSGSSYCLRGATRPARAAPSKGLWIT